MVQLEIKPTVGAQARVASVILTAIFLACVLGYLLTGGGRVLFAEKSTLYTYVPDAAGLAGNAEVRLSGIPIGKVSKVELSGYLDPQRSVKIEMQVNTAFLPNIPSDSQTSISADNLVGWQFVSIDEGKSRLPIQADGVMRSEPLKQAADRADLIKALSDELGQVDDLLTQMQSTDTPIGQLVNGEADYDQILKRVSGFQASLRSFESSQSPIGQILFSDKLYNQIHGYVTKVDETMSSIQRGEGAAGKLFTSDDQYNTFVKQLKDLRKSLADAGPTLRDESAYRRVQAMLKQTDATIASLNAGEGAVGQLMVNAQLYESLNGSLRSLQALLLDLQEHPQKYLRISRH